MQKDFRIGQYVDFLDMVGGGQIVGLNNDGTLNVVDNEGFELRIRREEVVPRNDAFLDQVKEEEIRLNSGDFQSAAKKHSKKRKKEKDFWEVDLHIHEITSSEVETSGVALIQIQLDHFKEVLNRAIAERQRHLVVIHGVGAGRLKQEIRKVLDQVDHCQYHDANILKYGKGATEVVLWTKSG